ncbi:MAG: S-layer homology domain-containing protein [Cyanobacteria bacterium P01_D01_bin.105]
MFNDITNHWASQCITALTRRQLISGYPNGKFRPQATVSRAEFTAILKKAFPDVSIKQAPLDFQDVSDLYWASEAIAWASERALFSGYPNGRFRPRLAVPRVQAVMVLMQAIDGTQGVDVTATLAPEEDNKRQNKKRQDDSAVTLAGALLASFTDAADIPAYAQAAIATALNQGLLETLPNPRPFRPQQTITRGELTAFLCRALDIPTAELIRPNPQLTAAQDNPSIFQAFLNQEKGFNQEKLAFLDKRVQSSSHRQSIANYAVRLQAPTAIEFRSATAAPYPHRGEVFFVNEQGLDFLPADVRSACVCLQSLEAGEIKGQWFGRDALSDRQLWSSTKFIPLLNVADQVNRIDPSIEISRCRVRSAGESGRFSGFPFEDLATAIMTYDNRIATSNALAVMFKRFETPERLEKWTAQMTGNQSLSFQGRYGEVPFIQNPELWSSQRNRVMLKSPGIRHSGQNLMSTYDLTRLITMAGWHWRLDSDQRIPHIQTRSLDTIVQAMGHDTARYIDVALATLGLSQWVREPVIFSKSGFGRSDQRDRTELTYCALAQFSLPRQIANPNLGALDPTAAYQHYSFGFTMIVDKNVGDANAEARYVDALMATAVTELIRRIVTGEML